MLSRSVGGCYDGLGNVLENYNYIISPFPFLPQTLSYTLPYSFKLLSPFFHYLLHTYMYVYTYVFLDT